MPAPIDGSKRRSRHAMHTVHTLRRKTALKDGCWEWTLSLSTHGYGQTTHGGRRIQAHRLIYALVHPTAQMAGKLVCHRCDNRKCINPEHLYLGTFLTNMRDMHMRGRARPIGCPGVNHRSAKLNPAKVRAIRKLHTDGIMGYRNLGKLFKVDRTVIRGIIKRMYWKHVP